jgi:hypothetical protein
MAPSVQIDDWRKTEAEVMNSVAAEYAKIGHELETQVASLTNLGKTIFTSQVSGPPAELLEVVWTAFINKINPITNRIYALSGDLTKQAKSWESIYQQQKSDAEKQVKDVADAAKAAATAVPK